MKVLKGQCEHQISGIILCWVLILVGCASPTARERLDERQNQSRARGAAYAAEGFTVDHFSPEPRPFRAWEFYYKDCALVSRNPYPDRAEYSCAEPH